MSPRKLLLLTAIVLVLFAFIILFERKMPSTSERKEKGELIWELPQDRFETLRLQRGGSAVELKKVEGGGWRIVKPEAYAADGGAVNDLASQLARLRSAGTETAEARPDDYGFKEPSAKATIVWKEEGSDKKTLTRTLELGIEIPGTDSTAARVAGSERVFFIPSSVSTAVKKGLDEFKSKEVFGGSTADAARLEIERGRGGRLSLSKKNGVWWLVQPIADLADGDAIQRFVGDLAALRALEFLPGPERQNLSSLSLAPPLYHVTLADPKGASTVVDFGATRSDGNSVYARRESQVFTVSSSITEELSKEAEAFREARLTRFDRAAVTGLSGSFSSASYTLARQPGGWVSTGAPVAAAAVDDLFTAIADLKSRSFVEDLEAGTKARQPEATLTIRSPGADWTIQLFALRGEARATVSGRPGAFTLASDPAAPLQAAFQKATASLPPTPAPKKK